MRRHFFLFALLFFIPSLLFSERHTVKIAVFPGDALSAEKGFEHKGSYLTDFLDAINRYTDFNFDYVEVDRANAEQSLLDGTVDIIPFFGREGASHPLLFSDIPSAQGNLILTSNREIHSADLTIGMFESAPKDLAKKLDDYASLQGLSYRIRTYPSEDAIHEALKNREIDAFLDIDLGLSEEYSVVATIETTFFYFAAAPKNQELFTQFNQSISNIYNLNPSFFNSLRARYIPSAHLSINQQTPREKMYVKNKKTVKVSVVTNQNPYCYYEKGEYKGFLIDTLKSLSEISGLSFEYIGSNTYAKAVQLVKANQADILYSTSDMISDDDSIFIKITNPIITMRMVAVGPDEHFDKDNAVLVAVRGQQYNKERIDRLFLPKEVIWCRDTEQFYDTLSSTKNSASFMSFLEFSHYEDTHLFPKLKLLGSEYSTDLSLGINRNAAPELISILDKAIYESTNSMLESYIQATPSSSLSLIPFIKRHLIFFSILAIILILLLTVAIFMSVLIGIKRRKDRQIQSAMNLANRDSMTGLYNHVAYERLVNKTLEFTAADMMSVFVMIDIDNFKRINDTLGHAKGDYAIVTIANILIQTFRQGDFKCRMGGDEFSVFMKNVTDFDAVCNKLKRMQAEITAFFKSQNFGVPVTCSAGVAKCTGPQIDAPFERLYRAADEGLYKVKLAGKDNFAVVEL